MSRSLVCATKPGSGVRHRFKVLSKVKHFADARGYSVCMLWGVTPGVGFCRYEELFASMPDVRVPNISVEQVIRIARRIQEGSAIVVGGQSLRVFRPGEEPEPKLFSWDFAGGGALKRLIPGRERDIVVRPAPAIRSQIATLLRLHGVTDRLGIRVRVEECLHVPRKPHRIRRELDELLRSIRRIPSNTPVFVVTDSEYIQHGLASHFTDTRFLPKEFDLVEPTGRYVDRQDKEAMFTFLKEVECLCQCRNIINSGGFQQDSSVRHKILEEPYTNLD